MDTQIFPGKPNVYNQKKPHSNNQALTFDALAALEPRLQTLADLARCWGAGPTYCELAAWRLLKGEVAVLVGMYAERDELRSSDAYDIAYRHIYGLLPFCQHTGVCW